MDAGVGQPRHARAEGDHVEELHPSHRIEAAGDPRPAELAGGGGEALSLLPYRFGDIYVQDVGGLAVFAAPVDLKATMDGRDWSGTVFVTDIWRKGRVRRGWKLAQRILSTPDERPELAKAIKSLQLWK